MKNTKYIKITGKNECNCEHDCLNRADHMLPLTTLLSNINDDSFVMSVSAPYGGGKTFFIQMWQDYLKNEGAHTLYYNAWEHDFSSNPLASFVSHFDKMSNIKPKTKDKIKGIAKAVQNVTLTRLPSILVSLFGKICENKLGISPDEFRECVELSTEIVDKTEQEINAINKKALELIETAKDEEKAIDTFKQQLNALIDEFKKEEKPINKKLIIFIDDLDRCNPKFAIKFLEYIKHLFSCPNCIFVLALDENQLKSSVNKIYGSENAEGFLAKIIDFYFRLPAPDISNLIEVLIEKFGWDDDGFPIFQTDTHSLRMKQAFIRIMNALSVCLSLTARDIEQIFQNLNIIYRSIEKDKLSPIHLAIIYTFNNYAFKIGCYENDKTTLFGAVFGKISTYNMARKKGDIIIHDHRNGGKINISSSLVDFCHIIGNNQVSEAEWSVEAYRSLSSDLQDSIMYARNSESLITVFNKQIDDIFIGN